MGDKNINNIVFKVIQILVVPFFIFGLGVYVKQVDNNINTNINNVKEQINIFRNDTDKQLCSYRNELKDYDDKAWKHFTNDEMHTPKSIVLTKAEFNIYQELRGREMSDLKELIITQTKEIKQSVSNLENIVEKMEKNGKK